jgi:phage shock protein PspC (stress-responsive transcriptional regulator)
VFEQSKSFPKLVGLSALLIAGSAAFFSVFGLSKLFAGAQFAVIIMASSLEFGKLVAASFLYRYWDKINFLQKFYMSSAILILITSAGIFGFLSNAYQGATVEFEKESTALIFKEDRLEQLQEDKVYLKEELDIAIKELPDNFRTARRKLREDYQPQITEINKQMIELKGEIGTLKTALVQTGVDVGPVIYLARTFDTDVDTVVKFFIFVLIFVFDPMAVMFVISYNVALQYTEEEEDEQTVVTEKKKKWWQMYGEKKEKVIKPKEIVNPAKLKSEVEELPEEEDENKVKVYHDTKKIIHE